MVKEVNGDILFSTAFVIAHGVAPHDHFESGLALSLRENHPSMYKDFRHYCRQYNPAPGEIWIWGGSGGKRIANLLTQEAPKSNQSHPGKASLSNVNQALKNLATEAVKESWGSISISRLATGVGGLDWQEVKPLIMKHLDPLPIPVYVYSTFSKGVTAAEK